jgi:cyclopropane-fatty-acyl-phospholipid synthase
MFPAIDQLLAKGFIPDILIRKGIRKLLSERLAEEKAFDVEKGFKQSLKNIQKMKSGPIAICTDEANDQHYQVDSQFFKLVLGKNLKYSSAYWDEKTNNLNQAEDKMLNLYIERAGLKNGQTILDLGCGWGSLSLFLAKKFPQSKITAVSNSKTQKIYIDVQAKKRKLKNLEVITCNINELSFKKKFDRIISIEMFEHMRNYQKLLSQVNSWLKKDGLLFVHIFTHKFLTYFFEVKDESDWMGKYFFTEGLMPSDQIFSHFNDAMLVKDHWVLSGKHYQKTADAWLLKMDSNKDKIMKIFNSHYGRDESKKWWNYWRIFFMSCSELWGYHQGNEWLVSHYLLEKR